ILAVSISSRKVRGGLGLHLAAGLLIGALFILFSKFSITFANSAVVPPALGVWLPNILFGIVTFVMYKQAQRWPCNIQSHVNVNISANSCKSVWLRLH